MYVPLVVKNNNNDDDDVDDFIWASCSSPAVDLFGFVPKGFCGWDFVIRCFAGFCTSRLMKCMRMNICPRLFESR